MAECLSDTDNFVEEIEPDDSTSSCSTVSVLSLLSRLKSPTPSDLSLKTNPPKGMKHGKGVVTAEPSIHPTNHKSFPMKTFLQ